MMNRFLCVMIILFAHTSVFCATLDALEFKRQNEQRIIAFKISGACMHKTFTLKNPDRVVVDFEQTTSSINLPHVDASNQLIRAVRIGHPTPHTLRFVFEVTQAVVLHTSASGGALTLVLDAKNTRQKVVTLSKTPVKSPAKSPAPVSQGPAKKLRDVIIVLDPGHGGKDPGAIGPRHNAEKNVVLAIGLKLKKLIDKQPGMHAVLTRHGDYYVGLRQRLMIARKHNADIFISIHADAFINRHSNGASVFALSPRGATSEAARWLAEKENNSELGGVNLSGLDDENGLIRTVLLDLSQTATISSSLQMGTRVLQHIDGITRLHNNKVEQARFVVLKSPDIPSILIETGFISNPREENNLASSAYQARLTQAIFNGIKRYFWEYPPHGTHVEVLSGANSYLVKKGDTLPAIAKQFNIAASSIEIANKLTNKPLQVGQALSIPSSWA